MKNIMFDGNAFSNIITKGINTTNFFDKCAEKYNFYVTAIQVEELANMPDEKKNLRVAHLLCLCKMRARLVNTRAIWGKTRYGCCCYSDGKDPTYKRLLNENNSNINDALIGDTAKKENCILVTDDKRFITKLKSCDIQTMTFDEFYGSLEEG